MLTKNKMRVLTTTAITKEQTTITKTQYETAS